MNTNTVHSDFTTRLYHKVAGAQAGANLFLSPFSIRVALAMCAAGARSDTRQTLTDLIGAPEDLGEQNRHFAGLLKSVHGSGDRPFQLVMANGLWVQQDYALKPEFEQTIAESYGGVVREVDFRVQPDQAVQAINAWAGHQTHGKIKELLNRSCINADARLVLTNAIYFQGRWEKVFDKTQTRDETWYGPETRRVPMMHQRGGYLYYEDKDFQALNLPYRGRQLSMLVVLPRKKDGLAALERQWAAPATFRHVTDGFDSETAVVSLPRFTVETELRLKPALCALHAELAFSDEADFSGIGEEGLKLSEVVHKAFVEVDEEGTEAAAATAAVMMLSTGAGSQPPEPKTFKADHPFLFFIWDRKAGTVLFCGRVVSPR